MMRGIFYVLLLLALLLGAALGIVWSLQAGPARDWLGTQAPQWMMLPDPDARLPQGRMVLNGEAFEPPVTVNWSDLRLSTTDASWAVQLLRTGGAAHGRAHLEPDALTFKLNTATVDLADFFADFGGLTGDVLLSSGQALMDWRGQKIQSAQARGLAQNLTWNAQNFGDFEVDLVLRPLQWKVALVSTAQNPIVARADISRLAGQSSLTLDLTLEDTPELQDGLRRILKRTGTQQGNSWRVQQAIPIR